VVKPANKADNRSPRFTVTPPDVMDLFVQDWSSTCGRSISAPGRLIFNSLKDFLQVSEEPLTLPSLQYSWDNARGDKARVMARFDRCYLFLKSLVSHRKLIEYKIRDYHSRSNHCLVSVIIELAHTPPRPSRWAMSLSILM
jgi:hypothetical protein